LAKPVQEVDLSVFRELEAGDILFLDTSHVSRFGSDVNDLFVRVIPSVAPGVLIHIHDIFWPFDFPLEWLEEGRAWNEAYVLRSFLQFNDSFEILLWNDWLATHHRELIAAELPRMLEAPGGSIWLRRTR
ncbi:MAG: class I SAM-dependent methyltransferase, partial [Microthrixaceae bacterium]